MDLTFPPVANNLIRFHEVWKEVEIVSTENAATPLVALSALRKQCRVVDTTDEDENIILYALAAEAKIESVASISLRRRVVNLNMARWPSYTDYLNLRLEFPMVRSVDYIKYYDSTDTQVTLSPSLYEFWAARNPPSILIRADNVPYLSVLRSKAVQVQVSVGYPDDIPANAKMAILELTAFWFQFREAYGRIPTQADGAQGRVFQSLIDTLRWRLYP